MSGCGGVSENSPRLIDLNIWPPAGRTVWDGLGGDTLLEGVC